MKALLNFRPHEARRRVAVPPWCSNAAMQYLAAVSHSVLHGHQGHIPICPERHIRWRTVTAENDSLSQQLRHRVALTSTVERTAMELLHCLAGVRTVYPDGRPPVYYFHWYTQKDKKTWLTRKPVTEFHKRRGVRCNARPDTLELDGLSASMNKLWNSHELAREKLSNLPQCLPFYGERYNDLAALSNEFFYAFVHREFIENADDVRKAVDALNERFVVLLRDVLRFAHADNDKQVIAKDRVMERLNAALAASDETYAELSGTVAEVLNR